MLIFSLRLYTGTRRYAGADLLSRPGYPEPGSKMLDLKSCERLHAIHRKITNTFVRGSPSQVKGDGFRVHSRRGSPVRIRLLAWFPGDSWIARKKETLSAESSNPDSRVFNGFVQKIINLLTK